MVDFLAGWLWGVASVWLVDSLTPPRRRRGSNPPPPGRKPVPPAGPPEQPPDFIAIPRRKRGQSPIRLDEGQTQRGNGNDVPTTPKPPIKPQPAAPAGGETPAAWIYKGDPHFDGPVATGWPEPFYTRPGLEDADSYGEVQYWIRSGAWKLGSVEWVAGCGMPWRHTPRWKGAAQPPAAQPAPPPRQRRRWGSNP